MCSARQGASLEKTTLLPSSTIQSLARSACGGWRRRSLRVKGKVVEVEVEARQAGAGARGVPQRRPRAAAEEEEEEEGRRRSEVDFPSLFVLFLSPLSLALSQPARV